MQKLWLILGFLCLALGSAGAVLPVLPTTPFILLAAWFFARSSPKYHRFLMQSKWFGPMLKSWQTSRCIPIRAKVSAIATILLFGGGSLVFFVPDGWPRWGTLILLGMGLSSVLLIPSCEKLKAK